MAINLSTLVNQTNPLQICKSWVNFNGSTATIRSSYNVSSITKNATSDYTVNYTTALTDANYSVSGSCQRNYPTQTGINPSVFSILASTSYNMITTTSVRIYTPTSGGFNEDPITVSVQVFGN